MNIDDLKREVILENGWYSDANQGWNECIDYLASRYNFVEKTQQPADAVEALDVDAIQTILDQYFEEVLKNKSYAGRTTRGATWARSNDQLNAIRALAYLELQNANHIAGAGKMVIPEGYALVPIEPDTVSVDGLKICNETVTEQATLRKQAWNSCIDHLRKQHPNGIKWED